MKTADKGTVSLRTFSLSDKERLAALCNDREIWLNLRDSFPHPYHETHAELFITECMKEKPRYTFAVYYNEELCGTTGLVRQTDIYRLSAEMGYWIGRAYWGKGIATRAVNLLTDYGFNRLGLIRIYAGVFESNMASRRVLEKAGFSLEGIAYRAVVKDEKLLNECKYAKFPD